MPAITGTVAMILASVGFQVYNSWRGSKQNALLQQKRQEFEQAAIKRQTERMWKLMREGEELNLQLEREKLKDRIKKLNEDVGMLLPELAVEKAINNWPMNVLPIVMKKQTLGNLIAGQFTESASLHCVFTPSNCTEFNKHVFFRVEKELERYCNQYWSMVSNHPIMFYSGAWKSKTSPTGTQVDLMRTALSNLPTILITPYFRPNDGKLVIQMHVWGVGSTDDNNMLSDTYEFEPNNFQRDYNNKDNYEKEAFLLDNIIEDLVPYLQCLIGYMADTYFWSSSGQAPLLPHLLIDKTINTDGMKYLISDSREYYDKLLLIGEERAKENPFVQDNLLNLYEGSEKLWEDEKTKTKAFNELLRVYFSSRIRREYKSISELKDSDCNLFDISDIDKLIQFCPNKNTEYQLNNLKERISHQPINLRIKRVHRLSLNEVIVKSCLSVPSGADKWHLFQDKGDGYWMVAAFFSKGNEVVYNQPSDIIVYFTQQFVIPQHIDLEAGINASIKQLEEMAELVSKSIEI